MPLYFWVGAALAYIGLAFTIVSIAIDRWFACRRVLRLVGLFAVLLTTATFSRFVAFTSVPVAIKCRFDNGDYPPGTVVAGIPWELGSAELQVVVSNKSDYDLSDVSFTLNSDMLNVAVGQLSALPGVSVGPYIMSRPMAKVQDKGGRTWDVPIQRQGGIWMVRCDKIPPNTGLTVVMAISDPEASADALMAGGSSGKRKPHWVTIEGSYKAVMKTRTIEERVTAF